MGSNDYHPDCARIVSGDSPKEIKNLVWNQGVIPSGTQEEYRLYLRFVTNCQRRLAAGINTPVENSGHDTERRRAETISYALCTNCQPTLWA